MPGSQVAVIAVQARRARCHIPMMPAARATGPSSLSECLINGLMPSRVTISA